jgi:glutamate racemase
LNVSDKSNPIGIFDSGIGGMTVVKHILSALPGENIIYFGDTARVPYGSKSNSTVIEYSLQNARFLIEKNVKLLVVACNTASSVALDELRNHFDVPVIGMIEPGAQLTMKKSRNKRIGVIGTYSTIGNKAYSEELKRIDPAVFVFEKPCPLFVPLAEEGWTDHEATKLIAEEYLNEFRNLEIDTVILGCTHYPILTDVIQEVLGEDIVLIDSGTASTMVVQEYLAASGLLNDSNNQGKQEYFVSDVPSRFKDVAERFLGRNIEHIDKVDLEYLTRH